MGWKSLILIAFLLVLGCKEQLNQNNPSPGNDPHSPPVGESDPKNGDAAPPGQDPDDEDQRSDDGNNNDGGDDDDGKNGDDKGDDDPPVGGDNCSHYDPKISDMWDAGYCPDGLTVQTCPENPGVGSNNDSISGEDGSGKCECTCPSAEQARNEAIGDVVWNEICQWSHGDIRGESCRDHFASNRTRTTCVVPNDDYLEGIKDAFMGEKEALIKLAVGLINAIRQSYLLGLEAIYPFGFRIYCGTNPITDPNGNKASWGDGDYSIGDCLTKERCSTPLLDKKNSYQ